MRRHVFQSTRSTPLKPAEIIAALRSKNPKLVGDLDDKKAEQLVKAAFTLVRDQVNETQPKNEAVFPMLGRFRVHEVTKGEGAEATTVRKINYLPAKPQQPKEGGEEGAEKPGKAGKAEKGGKADKAEKADQGGKGK
jgi:nucleoid DNA-binding protein